jgi:microcystin-dependent protein
MSDPFIGEIRLFPYTFAPRGWALCSGQILSIAQNTALFSLIGTIYGGDGWTGVGQPAREPDASAKTRNESARRHKQL